MCERVKIDLWLLLFFLFVLLRSSSPRRLFLSIFLVELEEEELAASYLQPPRKFSSATRLSGYTHIHNRLKKILLSAVRIECGRIFFVSNQKPGMALSTALRLRCGLGDRSASVFRRAASCAVVFDVDGVLVRGKETIDAAPGVLRGLVDRNIPFLVMTNGGGVYEEKRAESLSERFGVKIHSDQIIQSHTPMKEQVATHADDRVLLVGKNYGNLTQLAEAYGFRDTVTVEQYHREVRTRRWVPRVCVFRSFLVFRSPLKQKWAGQTCGFICSIAFCCCAQVPLSYPDMSPVEAPPIAGGISSKPIKAILALTDPIYWGRELQICCDVLLSGGVLGPASTKQQVRYAYSIPTHPPATNLYHKSEKKVTKYLFLSLLLIFLSQVPLYSSCADLIYAAEYEHSPRFGSGSFIVALEALYGKLAEDELSYVKYGKPYSRTFDYAHTILKVMCAYPFSLFVDGSGEINSHE